VEGVTGWSGCWLVRLSATAGVGKQEAPHGRRILRAKAYKILEVFADRMGFEVILCGENDV
jgi:hypothetical protein